MSGLLKRLLRSSKRLRWKLTLSYTIVTVGALVAAMVVVLAISFNTMTQIFNTSTVPELMSRQIASDVAPLLRPYLSETPPDVAGVAEWLELVSGSTVVTGSYSNLRLCAERSVSIVIVDSEQLLVGQWPEMGSSGAVIGQPLTGSSDMTQGLIIRALMGEGKEGGLYQLESESIIIAAPVVDEQGTHVLGVIALCYEFSSTATEMVNTLLVSLGINLLCFAVAAGVVGTIFGALTARTLTRRLNKLSEASEAWSKGDFTVFVLDTAGDELGQLARRLDRMAEQFQNLLEARQELAALEERNRMARDLHDSAKQQAFGVSAQLGAVASLLERDPQAARTQLEKAAQLADNLRHELSTLIHQFRPSQLESKEFTASLYEYIAEWSRLSGIDAEFRCQMACSLPAQVEQVLLRIVQEALANAARHSQAHRVEVYLTCTETSTTLSISDDGCGFDVQWQDKGLGLRSMSERAESIGGSFSIESRPGQGTRILVTHRAEEECNE